MGQRNDEDFCRPIRGIADAARHVPPFKISASPFPVHLRQRARDVLFCWTSDSSTYYTTLDLIASSALCQNEQPGAVVEAKAKAAISVLPWRYVQSFARAWRSGGAADGARRRCECDGVEHHPVRRSRCYIPVALTWSISFSPASLFLNRLYRRVVSLDSLALRCAGFNGRYPSLSRLVATAARST